MSTLLIFGATGETGRQVFKSAFTGGFQKVVQVGRSEYPIATIATGSVQHEFIQVDFEKLTSGDSGEIEKIKSVKADAIICAMGTTKAGAGSMEKFIRIDHDYVLAGAKAAFNPGARLLYLSSGGSNSSSFAPYLKSKGVTEEDLAKIGFAETIVFRPGLLLVPGGRKEHRLAEAITVKIFSVITLFTSALSIETPILGSALVKAASMGIAGLEKGKFGKKETLATKEIWSIGNTEAERLAKSVE